MSLTFTLSCSVVPLWYKPSSEAKNPQNLLVSLLIILHWLDRDIGVRVALAALWLQKYCQIFWRKVSCFNSLPCVGSRLVLSHANTSNLSSSTLKLTPRFPLLVVMVSILGEKLEISIGLFWDTPNKGESISMSPSMILAYNGKALWESLLNNEIAYLLKTLLQSTQITKNMRL